MHHSKMTILSIASIISVIYLISVLFFYKRQVENKTTHIPTGCKEIPLLQGYY
jgi:hypothetical protein